MRAAFVVALSLVTASLAFGQELKAVPEIVDADTVYMGTIKVRLGGVDAPETEQLCLDGAAQSWPCGVEIKNRLQTFSAGRSWVCRVTGTDIYGRSLARCAVGGDDVGRWLVKNGLALAFRKYSGEYVADENEARSKAAGLWSGAFIAPWDWRHRGSKTAVLGAANFSDQAQRLLTSGALAAAPPERSCTIKGNFARRDHCIYHLPGDRHYERLRMDKTDARRWFCSAADAEAAGCRRARI